MPVAIVTGFPSLRVENFSVMQALYFQPYASFA